MPIDTYAALRALMRAEAARTARSETEHPARDRVSVSDAKEPRPRERG
ncbi:hypothetical protein [Streptomyces tsukubensis]|nr:hypothetical protein [Streptomyces tsukubensis]